MSEAAVARANQIPEGDLYGCALCGKTIGSAEQLAYHKKYAHKDDAIILKEVRPEPRFSAVAVGPKATKISTAIQTLVRRHGNLCHWCKTPVSMNVPAEHPLAPTREHLVPKSLGGTGLVDNIAIVHRHCNHLRGTIDAGAFRRLMRGDALTKEELWPHHFLPRHVIDR